MKRSILPCLLLGTCLAAGAGAPPPEAKSGETASLLRWAEHCMKEAAQQPEAARKQAAGFESLLRQLDALPAEIALKNPRFEADHQQLRLSWQLYLHHAFRGASTAEAKVVLEKLKGAGAHPRLLLPFLEKCGLSAEYYAAQREVLEQQESRPELLPLPPEFPPHFELDPKLSVRGLHDALAVYDLARAQHWSPAPEEDERILLGLAALYEKAGLDQQALTALRMLAPEHRGAKARAELRRLEEKRATSAPASLY